MERSSFCPSEARAGSYLGNWTSHVQTAILLTTYLLLGMKSTALLPLASLRGRTSPTNLHPPALASIPARCVWHGTSGQDHGGPQGQAHCTGILSFYATWKYCLCSCSGALSARC